VQSNVHESSVSALLVGIKDSDRRLIHEICRHVGWRLFEARNRRQALCCLARNPVHLVIAEKDAPHWDWKGVLNDLRLLAHPPQLIVASRNADDYLWAEALNIGAFDVLARPFQRDEAERVMISAGRHSVVSPARSEGALTAGGAGSSVA
jgi:DNA-binding NtrC family response regulator